MESNSSYKQKLAHISPCTQLLRQKKPSICSTAAAIPGSQDEIDEGMIIFKLYAPWGLSLARRYLDYVVVQPLEGHSLVGGKISKL